jgi:hypothetical protein
MPGYCVHSWNLITASRSFACTKPPLRNVSKIWRLENC